jgi:uncharacterized membrane protein YbhN (UPF0104 family)
MPWARFRPEDAGTGGASGGGLRARLFFLLKAGVSAGLVVWLGYRFNWAQVVLELRRVPWPYPVIAYLAVFAGYGLFALRLRYLLHAQAIDIGFLPLLRITFVGLFSGNFLPSSMGGDAVKITLLFRQYHHRRSHLALSVVADRFSNIAATFLLLALVFSLPRLLSPFFAVPEGSLRLLRIGWPVGALLLAAGFLFARRRLRRAADLDALAHAPSAGLGGKIKRAVRSAAANWAAAPGRLLVALALSILSTLIFYGAGGILGLGLGVRLRPGDWVALQGILACIGILPISLNGLGVQEVSVAYLLTRLGATPEQGMAFALLNRVLFVSASLPGAMGIVMRRPAGAMRGGGR